MERSDPNDKAADAAPGKSEQAKPAPDGSAAPAAAEPKAPRPYEPIALETVIFDPVDDFERAEDVTQPLWRTGGTHPAHAAAFEPRGEDGPAPADAGHSEPPPEVAPPEPREALPSAPEHLWEDVPENVLETTVPVHASEPSESPAANVGATQDAAPIIEAVEQEAVGPLAPTETAAAPPVATEPAAAEAAPVELAAVEGFEHEHVAAIDQSTAPAVPESLPPEAVHPSEPVQASVPHIDTASVWSPSYAEVPAPVSAPAAQPATASKPRGFVRELMHRAVRIAAIAFAGWAFAVVLLIVIFRFVNPPFSMLMALRFMSGTPIHYEWVPLEQISPNLSRAVIVAEDGRFCQHMGVDFVEMAKAIERATDGYPRGASTISMQVSKNLFLLPVKSYLRKIVEVPLTFVIELAWPKRRILEVYLNIVEWGPGVFGAEAAARSHFGRPASSLTPRQAAQLAVVLPNPIVRDAGSPGPRTAQRASIIQSRAARTPEAASCIGR
jgi:monofunctional biosynthetic peptidoglycan transglycosylase